MTFKEIADKFEELRVQRLRVPVASYSNYRSVVSEYQHILNDMLVLCRNLAQNLVPVVPPFPSGVELPAELNPMRTVDNVKPIPPHMA